jgi:hypothetical protein
VFQLLNLRFQGAQLFQQRLGVLARLFAQGDLFGDAVLLGGEGLHLGSDFAPPLVDCQPFVEEVGWVAAFVQRVAHRVGFTAQESVVQHTANCTETPASGLWLVVADNTLLTQPLAQLFQFGLQLRGARLRLLPRRAFLLCTLFRARLALLPRQH